MYRHNLIDMESTLRLVSAKLQKSPDNSKLKKYHAKLSSMVYWNRRLKSCQTWIDFQIFEKDLKDFVNQPDSVGIFFVLQTKKRHIEVQHFTHLYEYFKNEHGWKLNGKMNRVSYVICDQHSSGEADVRNLHRVLFVGE